MAAGGEDDGSKGAAVCPVDHHHQKKPSEAACPVDHGKPAAEACPVDHKSREVWLSQARAAAAAAAAATAGSASTAPASHPPAPAATPRPSSSSSSSSSSWNPLTWRVPFLSSSTPQATAPPPQQKRGGGGGLDEGRVVSSIPRALPPDGAAASSPYPTSPTPAAAAPPPPSNHENETGADAATGNWVYPSEKMFFEALKRKGNTGGADGARPADMRTVVPIHNAVNERAWGEIKRWEAPYTGPASQNRCGGPKLESFSGLAAKMSPRARINTWLGYTAPFDRHDWVVDRCGVKVEYVIDFYAGRPGAASSGAPHKLNFYLDVRPKLNTWEGVKMRAFRALGIV